MNTPSVIQHEENAAGGRYVLHLDGVAAAAVLDYRRAGPGQVIAQHTYVPDAMRGQGIAQQLVERLVADARTQGWRIDPQCSYVRVLAQRHPEWADVFA